ncbi:hypothetical protein [Burkholderia multivorans]|uniref:hypothetical protein n=1 Tax=Burkholderia multivorans TaxID=87883 RepID=UPI0021C1C82B|nr:hypothetical protein [Burkholderia multivorans]
MNDQQQSRADALTEAQRKALETAVNVLNINWEHETANELWEAFTAPVSQPAAEPIDAPSVNETITYSGDSLTLSGAQLIEALDFIAPDRDADQLESEVTIQYGEGHTGKGMYCWCTEYPEEGAIFIDGSTAIPTEAAPAPSPADERAAFEYDDVVSICDAHGICLPVDCVEMVVEIVKRSGLLAARAASANETGAEGIRAWETADGRVMTDEQKRRALAEGGATATAARPYSIPLWRFGEAPAMAAEAVALSATMMLEAAARSGLRATMGRLNATDILDPLEAYTLDMLRQINAAPQPAQADASVDERWEQEILSAQADASAYATPIPYDGLTEEFTDEVARLANDASGIREAIAGALESCGAVIVPADAQAEAREPHSDDVAVDSFAAVMKHKLALAREKGRGGWETCSPADLSRMLREHVEKGDPRDVANLAMMIWHHGAPIAPAIDAAEAGDVPECNGSHDAGQIAAGDKECTACGE